MRQLKITKQVTNRETASLDKYLQEIGRVELITAEEEVELAQKIKAGDERALDKLTKANLNMPFVKRLQNSSRHRQPLTLRLSNPCCSFTNLEAVYKSLVN
mgnify:CR=1 FL=1